MKKLRLGILGCGKFIQRRILPALKEVEDFDLVCLHNRDPKKAKELAQTYHVPIATSSREELLQNVDVVYVASPNHLHEEDAIACAKFKKPTLCEKPLAPTVAGINNILAAFKENQTPIFVGHSLRFKPSVQKAKKMLEQNELGKLLSLRAYVTIPLKDDWRHKKEFGGGVLQDLGVHLVDLIQYISNQRIVNVLAMGHFKEVDETVMALCRLEDNSLASFTCSFEQPLSSGFEIIGTEGRIISQDSLRQTYDPVETFCHIKSDDTKIFPRLPASNIYVDELKHFAGILLKGEKPIIDAHIALQNQKVIESIFPSREVLNGK